MKRKLLEWSEFGRRGAEGWGGLDNCEKLFSIFRIFRNIIIVENVHFVQCIYVHDKISNLLLF